MREGGQAVRRTGGASEIMLAGLLLVIGCAGRSKPPPADPSWLDRIPVHVTNHHFLDVSVYALFDGQRTRIGTAVGSSSTRMNIPYRLLGPSRDMQLAADAIGSDEQTVTPTITIQPGQFIELLLESRLARSSVGVY